jgi:hypothetical protein
LNLSQKDFAKTGEVQISVIPSTIIITLLIFR